MIPLAKDTRESIGSFAERVENRSLLFEKMILSKSSLHDVDRFDDAPRFNVLRATHEGSEVLKEERESSRRYASRGGSNTQTATYKAKVAGALSSINVDDPDLAKSRIRSQNRFLLDLESSYRQRAVTFPASLGGRLLINMAGGVMENSGLSLDRVTGLPFIPGTALKGIARHCALWKVRLEDDPQEKIRLLRVVLAVFGFAPSDLTDKGDFLWALHGKREHLATARQDFQTDTFKGLCSFLTAHPSQLDQLRIVAEVLTPHRNNTLRPIFFPAVEAGSEFAFAIIAPRTSPVADLDLPRLLDHARNWLHHALTENGAGAKTGAGYGWFIIDPQAEARRREVLENEAKAVEADRLRDQHRRDEEKRAAEEAAAEEARLDTLTPEQREEEELAALSDQPFAEMGRTLADQSETRQRAYLSVLRGKKHKETRKRWKKKKPELWNAITCVAEKLNISLD